MSQGRAEEANEAACADPAVPGVPANAARTTAAAMGALHTAFLRIAFLRLRNLFWTMGAISRAG
jgi:hypothetical protein